MIRIENISKQNSHRLLFIETSAALNKGEKIGLVGPNGAGKTTLFRMITGEELPDEGQSRWRRVSPLAILIRMSARCPVIPPWRR